MSTITTVPLSPQTGLAFVPDDGQMLDVRCARVRKTLARRQAVGPAHVVLARVLGRPLLRWLFSPFWAEIGRGRFGVVLQAQRIADGEVSAAQCPMLCLGKPAA